MIFLLTAGAVAGFVDSIIGGGGLITVPVLMLRMGIRPEAIGTNKVAAMLCTLVAVLVYGWNRRMNWGAALRFAFWVGLGSATGAAVSPRWLSPAYPYMLGLGTILCLAAIVFRRHLLAERENDGGSSRADGIPAKAAGLGFLCGLYDGAWGPGGGTFMFLALLYATPLGLMGSIAAAKVANFASSFLALSVYASQGLVRWPTGLLLGVSLGAGALVGARLALKHANRLLVPLLGLINLLLLAKLWMTGLAR